MSADTIAELSTLETEPRMREDNDPEIELEDPENELVKELKLSISSSTFTSRPLKHRWSRQDASENLENDISRLRSSFTFVTA